jgi:TIR domain
LPSQRNTERPNQAVTPTVFINFRTSDAEDSAALIERELSRRFGSEKIFRAEKSVRAGDDIETTIMGAVRRSRALVAVIGPRWLTATDDRGRRAIDSADDWTRREIVEAHDHGVRIIPVLVGKIAGPTPADLPPAMDWLPGCKYLRLSYRDVDAGLDRLADELADLVPGLDETTRNEPAPAAVSQVFNGKVDARHATFGIVNH